MLFPLASFSRDQGQTLGEVEQQPNGTETRRQLTFIEKVMLAGVTLNGISLAIHLWETRRREALLRKELARSR